MSVLTDFAVIAREASQTRAAVVRVARATMTTQTRARAANVGGAQLMRRVRPLVHRLTSARVL